MVLYIQSAKDYAIMNVIGGIEVFFVCLYFDKNSKKQNIKCLQNERNVIKYKQKGA